jgi:hypothetical protein
VVFDSGNPYTDAKVTAQPSGTVFRFTITGNGSGGATYNITIPVKSGNEYVFDPGVALDGNDTTLRAFEETPSTTVNVKIWYAEVRKFKGSIGGVNKQDSAPINTRDGWELIGCKVHHNKFTGIRMSGAALVRGGKVYSNGQYGFGGGTHNGVVDGVEIYDNGYASSDTVDAVGVRIGTNRAAHKIVRSNGFTYRNCYIHNNFQGIWPDGWNHNILIEDCRIWDNTRAGIFHEIGCKITIRRNDIRRNGTLTGETWPEWGAIKISMSPGNSAADPSVIADNYIECEATSPTSGGGYHGIGLRNQTHNGWKSNNGTCCLGVRHFVIERNTIVMKGSAWISAMMINGSMPDDSIRDPSQRCGQPNLTDKAANIIVRNNHYYLSGGKYPSTPFTLGGPGRISPAQWKAAGYDAGSVFH